MRTNEGGGVNGCNVITFDFTNAVLTEANLPSVLGCQFSGNCLLIPEHFIRQVPHLRQFTRYQSFKCSQTPHEFREKSNSVESGNVFVCLLNLLFPGVINIFYNVQVKPLRGLLLGLAGVYEKFCHPRGCLRKIKDNASSGSTKKSI